MNKKELINEIMWLAEFNSGGTEEERKNATKKAEKLFDKYIDKLLLSGVNNNGAIPYNSLSDNFKKSIDSIEDNLNLTTTN